MTEAQARATVVNTAIAWLGCKEADGSKFIRLIHLPSQNLSDQNHPESNHATQKV